MYFSSTKTRQAFLQTPLLINDIFQNKHISIQFSNALFMTRSLYFCIFMCTVIHIHICPCTVEHVQLYYMSVSNTLVKPICNRTTVIKIVFLHSACTCVLKDIVDLTQLLDKNLISYKVRHISITLYQFYQILLKLLK